MIFVYGSDDSNLCGAGSTRYAEAVVPDPQCHQCFVILLGYSTHPTGLEPMGPASTTFGELTTIDDLLEHYPELYSRVGCYWSSITMKLIIIGKNYNNTHLKILLTRHSTLGRGVKLALSEN